MRRMIHSQFERLVPRVASAGVMLLLTRYVTPETVGSYQLIILALIAYQSVTDSAIRQIAVNAIRSRDGMRFLVVYRRYAAFSGVAWMTIVVTAVAGGGQGRSFAIETAPLLLVPVATAFYSIPVAQLQSRDSWKLLVSGQAFAAGLALAAAIPVLIATRSILAPSVYLVVSECFFLIFVVFTSRRLGGNTSEGSKESSWEFQRGYRSAAFDGFLGFIQGQSDRLMIGMIAGAGALGSYSVAYSASRSVGEAAASGTANIVRRDLASAHFNTEIQGIAEDRSRIVAEGHLARAVYTSGAIVVATWIGARVLLRPLMGPEWDDALDAVPVLAITSIPIVIAWSTSTILVVHGRLTRSIPIRIFGVVTAVAIGYAASVDLTLAAWLCLARDIISMLAIAVIARKAAPWRAVCHAIAVAALLGLALWLMS